MGTIIISSGTSIKKYILMLKETINIVKTKIKEGKTLEQKQKYWKNTKHLAKAWHKL